MANFDLAFQPQCGVCCVLQCVRVCVRGGGHSRGGLINARESCGCTSAGKWDQAGPSFSKVRVRSWADLMPSSWHLEVAEFASIASLRPNSVPLVGLGTALFVPRSSKYASS